MPPTLEHIIPAIRIFDVAKAREFYLDYLGFSVDFEQRFGDNAPLFMQISRDGVSLRLSEHHRDGSPGIHLMVAVKGVDELHEELVARKYPYMNPRIENTEWGTRDVGVIDPFGNRLTFTEPIGDRA